MSNQSPTTTGTLILETDGTASDFLVPARTPQPTAATSVSVPVTPTGRLTIYTANLRDKVELLSTDVSGIHQQLQRYDLDERAQLKARKSVQSLLEELAIDRGMSWSNIARLIGVSVGAIRKWRKDGAATGENRLALGLLSAFLDLLDDFAVEDPAGWLEVPLISGYTVTALDLYREGKVVSLLDYAGHRTTAIQLLDEYDPDWREKYRTDFTVFEAADGNLAIGRR